MTDTRGCLSACKRVQLNLRQIYLSWVYVGLHYTLHMVYFIMCVCACVRVPVHACVYFFGIYCMTDFEKVLSLPLIFTAAPGDNTVKKKCKPKPPFPFSKKKRNLREVQQDCIDHWASELRLYFLAANVRAHEG